MLIDIVKKEFLNCVFPGKQLNRYEALLARHRCRDRWAQGPGACWAFYSRWASGWRVPTASQSCRDVRKYNQPASDCILTHHLSHLWNKYVKYNRITQKRKTRMRRWAGPTMAGAWQDGRGARLERRAQHHNGLHSTRFCNTLSKQRNKKYCLLPGALKDYILGS